MYLDYAERQVKLGKIISMKEWKEIHLEDGKVGWVPASAIEVI
mgnify:CR=1 FL=1